MVLHSQALRDIGLSENEAAVYLSLLKVGSSTVEKISQHSGVHRRNVYDILNRLLEHGLASYVIENGSKKFSAAPPEKLMDLQLERVNAIEGILPELKSLKGSVEEHQVKTFRGKEGLKAILEDEIKTGKPVFCMGATGRLDEILGEPYYWNVCKRRAEKGITLKAIFNQGARNRKITKMPKVVSRFMPYKFHSFVPIWVYDNKVALFVWAEDPSVLVVMIEDKKIADAFKEYFKILWRIAKK